MGASREERVTCATALQQKRLIGNYCRNEYSYLSVMTIGFNEHLWKEERRRRLVRYMIDLWKRIPPKPLESLKSLKMFDLGFISWLLFGISTNITKVFEDGLWYSAKVMGLDDGFQPQAHHLGSELLFPQLQKKKEIRILASKDYRAI